MKPGVVVNLSGTKYVVPALTLGTIRRMQDKMVAMTKGVVDGIPTPETHDTIIEIVHAAISRNYPSMSKEEIADIIDLNNMNELIRAVMGQSGLEQVTEVPMPGEAPVSQ